MDNKLSCYSIVMCCSLFLILYPNLGCLASRKLHYFGTPTPAGNNVKYEGETRNGVHGQIVYNNGQPKSKAGTVRDKNGTPVVTGTEHKGSQIGTVNSPNGTPTIQANATSGDQSGIINGNDGKPQIEVHRSSNGAANVTIYGPDGKPLFHYDVPPTP